MKKSILIFFTLIFSLLAAGCSHQQEVYFYKSFDNRTYNATGGNVRVVMKNDRWFIKRGYRKFSQIGVRQRHAECFSTCEYYKYDKSIYQYLADEAAKRGAHIVQLLTKARIKKFNLTRSTIDCLKWGTKRVKVRYRRCRGGEVGSGTVRECDTYYRYEDKRVCLKYKTARGTKHVLWTNGVLWRKKR